MLTSARSTWDSVSVGGSPRWSLGGRYGGEGRRGRRSRRGLATCSNFSKPELGSPRPHSRNSRRAHVPAIAQAKARLDEMQTALANAEDTLARQSRLAVTGATSRQSADDAPGGARRCRRTSRISRTRRTRARRRGARAEDIAIARAELVAAQAKLAGRSPAVRRGTRHSRRRHHPDARRRTHQVRSSSPGATVYALSLRECPSGSRTLISASPRSGRIHPGISVKVTTDSRPGRTRYQVTDRFISSCPNSRRNRSRPKSCITTWSIACG